MVWQCIGSPTDGPGATSFPSPTAWRSWRRAAHCINPLTTPAGDKVRATITGVFITPAEHRVARAPGGGAQTPDTKTPTRSAESTARTRGAFE
jgi:hypothetical protein